MLLLFLQRRRPPPKLLIKEMFELYADEVGNNIKSLKTALSQLPVSKGSKDSRHGAAKHKRSRQ